MASEYVLLDERKITLDQVVALSPDELAGNPAYLGAAETSIQAGRRITTMMAAPGGPKAVLAKRRSTGQVIRYAKEYLVHSGRSSRHRYLCGRYPGCRNPEGPWMGYCQPSRTPEGGDQLCSYCRRRYPSEHSRRILTEANRARAKSRRVT